VLGAVLAQTGRYAEAVDANQTAVALSPQDAIAHCNLGITLQELGRLEDAEASYKQAIALKPDYAKAQSNLGNTLKELGRLDEAEASYNQAIALKPDYAEAHSNLGVTLVELKRLDDAEASYNQAIALKPDYAEAHNNLGNMLVEIGRLDEALASYNQAIVLKPDFAEAILNLSVTQSYMNDLEAEIVSLQNALQIGVENYDLRAGVNLAICKFLEGDFVDSKEHLLASAKIQEKTLPILKNEKIYHQYLSRILKWRENKYLDVKKGKNDKNLYVVGESHSLTSHHLCIQNSVVNFFCIARLIKGCKQWHLGNAFRNQYKHQFETIFFALPKNSYVLLAIGEIDCRLDTGIFVHKRKFPEKQIKEIISNTIENYLNYIVNNNSDYQHNITIQGVPCPNLDVRNHSQKDIRQLSEIIRTFNYELKMHSMEKGFGFLDTHQLTNKGDGMSNGSWHIDHYHLSPEGMQEAWRRYGSEKSYEQF
jgi:tetratricopeptide (TPR) repeat protein